MSYEILPKEARDDLSWFEKIMIFGRHEAQGEQIPRKRSSSYRSNKESPSKAQRMRGQAAAVLFLDWLDG